MIPVLMYHHVTNETTNIPRGILVTADQFKKQMKLMKRLGYQGLSIKDLIPYLKGEKKGKVVGITFDDGYQNVYENTLPILNELGFTSTHYIVANQLAGTNQWDGVLGVPEVPLMTTDMIKELHQQGHEIGSHTLDHPHLDQITLAEAKVQIESSKKQLEDLLSREVSAFCYPYGDYNAAVRNLVEAAGYTNATSVKRGLVWHSDDIFQLPRVSVEHKTNILTFLLKIATKYEDRRARRI